MYLTLSDLRNQVEKLIERHGESSHCAAFIFTNDNVCADEVIDEQYVEVDCDSLEEAYPGIIDATLIELGGSDYIMEQCFEIINDEIERFRSSYNVTA